MIDLKEKHCVPCEGGIKAFDADQISIFKQKLAHGWKVIDNKKLQREFPFENFKRGMA